MFALVLQLNTSPPKCFVFLCLRLPSLMFVYISEIILTVIYILQYFTSTGEHIALYKINKNVYIKPQK